MQGATTPSLQPVAVGPSSSSSTSSATTMSDSSRRVSPSQSQVGTPCVEPGMRFVANHHRQHNPHDPKLRENPSFKSRRSSLFGAVLKSKSKSHSQDEPHRSAKATSTTSRSAVPILAKPRGSSVGSHRHTNSVPSHQNIGTAATTSDIQAEPALQRHDTRRSRVTSSHFRQSTHETPSELRHFHHAGSSPPTTSLPSPVELAEGSSSTCSSANAKSINFAAISGHPSPPSMSAAFDSIPEQPSGHTHIPQVTSFEASSPLSAGEGPSRSLGPSPIPTPLITRTLVSEDDDNTRSDPPQLNVEPVHLAANTELEPATCTQSSQLPPLATSYPSASHDDLANPDLPRSASVTSPQRFSSLGRRSAAGLTVVPAMPDPRSLPRAAARDINDELDSPTSPEQLEARAERRMSMLDFLVADSSSGPSLQLAQASLSAEHLPRSTQAGPRAPASVPLVQASRQLRLEVAAARAKTLQPKKLDLCEHVRVSVEPMVDRLTMFGSMQSSSNYSLAGAVVVEVPRLNVPRLSAAAALARDGTTVDRPTVHVEALTVRFIGYSVYVDATGRFNAIKLAELSQELLQPQGFACPVELVEPGTEGQATSPTDDIAAKAAQGDIMKETLKFETEFDLSIPGWLPASQRSRFGATFYCVQATAVVEGQAILSAFSGFDGIGSDSAPSQPSVLNLARSLESELQEPSANRDVAQRKDGTRSPPASTRSKTKSTWLNKTAKTLQLRTSRKSTGPDAEQSGSLVSSRRGSGSGSKDVTPVSGESDPLFTKTTEAANQLLPNGQHFIKSACLNILVRRCRDVVPVPVARLARLATASQVLRADGVPPSLSQSMLALARLQEIPDPASAPGTAPTQASTSSGRPNLPVSASAPVSLASLAGQRQSEAMRIAVPPTDTSAAEVDTLSPNTTATEAADSEAGTTQAPPTLAPSPRIDTHARTWRQQDASTDREPVIMPRAPSAFDAPRDPAKLAAAASTLMPSATLPNLPSSMSRASSLFDSRFGNANSPPRTSSRSASVGRSSAPLRHFVHRPTLHLPPELGVIPDKDAAGGLTFSLTLSLPSHVHVAGPKSDVLSFGVQIEVGRTEGWDALRKWGGLRLKDMELVCLQTERHSSMPSRSFCATFPVPPPPNRVDAADLPVVTSSRKTPLNLGDAQAAAAETRLRQSYDRSLVLSHISLANQGKAPHPVEHNVERIRTTIVGPPPFTLPKPGQDAAKEDGDKARKGKTRVNINNTLAERPSGFARSLSRDSPSGSGTHTPDGTSQGAGISSLRAAFAPTAQVNSGSRASVMQPLPRALARSNNSSSSSLRQALQGTDGSGAMQPAPRPSIAGALMGAGSSPNGPSRSRRPIPFDIGSTTTTIATGRSNANAIHARDASAAESDEAPFADATATTTTASSSQAGTLASRVPAHPHSEEAVSPDGLASGSQRRNVPETWSRERDGAATSASSSAARVGVSSTVSAARSANRAAPRRSRFETAISRLSTFASSMLEQPNEAPTSSQSREARAGASAASSSSNAAAAASLRATYAFAGDDGQGVDLTKGRVRMTINLPLVPSDLEAARKAGSAQLMPDFESPYVRVRHKLKVKLGFGMKSNVATGQDGEEWAQALVMCVPVRFTEAPPKEVQEQFGPVSLVTGGGQSATQSGSTAAGPDTETAAAATASDGQNQTASVTGSDSSSALPATFAEPLLPAYAQLFRDDGSRLADEGEDLPRYPGRMSVVGEIDEDPSSDAAAAAEAVRRAELSSVNAPTSNSLSTVDEDQAVPESTTSSNGSPNSIAVPAYEPTDLSRQGSSRYEASTLPRLASFATPPAPTLMDRTTSLPGHRMLTRTNSSGIFGLRTSPSHSTLSGQSQSAASATFAEKQSIAEGKARVGSSAFDPLPPRPGMRRRSATTASLVTFSRITPAEVLDEALVTSALDDEEDRMDGMQPSHTFDSLGARSRRGDVDIMDGSGQDEDEDEDDDEEEMGDEIDDEDEEDVNMDDVESPRAESEVGHASLGLHIHPGVERRMVGSDGDDQDQEQQSIEIGRAM